MSKVAIVKVLIGYGLVLTIFELIDYKKSQYGLKRVLMKVNFISTRTW